MVIRGLVVRQKKIIRGLVMLGRMSDGTSIHSLFSIVVIFVSLMYKRRSSNVFGRGPFEGDVYVLD